MCCSVSNTLVSMLVLYDVSAFPQKGTLHGLFQKSPAFPQWGPMHIHTRACMHAVVHTIIKYDVCIQVGVHACMCVNVRVHTCKCMHVCVCVCINGCIFVCCVCMPCHACMYAGAYLSFACRILHGCTFVYCIFNFYVCILHCEHVEYQSVYISFF